MSVESVINQQIAIIQDKIKTNGLGLITGEIHQTTWIGVLTALATLLNEPDDYLINQFPPYDPDFLYEGGNEVVVTYDGKLWAFVSDGDHQGVQPGTTVAIWFPVSALSLAHFRNQDQYLALGGTNQVSAQEIREFIDNLAEIVAPGLSTVLGESNITGGQDIKITGTSVIDFTAAAISKVLMTLPGNSYIQHLTNGGLVTKSPLFALLDTAGIAKFVVFDDGSVEVGSPGKDGRLIIWNGTTKKKVTIVTPVITEDRLIKTPDGDVDFTGAATGDVLTKQLDGSFKPQPPPGAGTGGQVDSIQGTPNEIDIDNTNPISPKASLSSVITNALANKVDKITGKGLSDENYTLSEKQKLAGLESSKYRGLFTSFAALPNTGNTDGSYADVDAGIGSEVKRYIWDVSDSGWVELGAGTTLTAAQIKTMYESNPDTNALTDSLLGLINSAAQSVTSGQYIQVGKSGNTYTPILMYSSLFVQLVIDLAAYYIGDAPNDGLQYVRRSQAWVENSPLEEKIVGTAIHISEMTGNYALDLEAFTTAFCILTGNTTLTTPAGLPALGESFVRTLYVKPTSTEIFTLPASWITEGEYVNDGNVYAFRIEFSNYPEVGLMVMCFITKVIL